MPPGREHLVGDGAHQSARRAAVDEGDAAPGELAPEGRGSPSRRRRRGTRRCCCSRRRRASRSMPESYPRATAKRLPGVSSGTPFGAERALGLGPGGHRTATGASGRARERAGRQARGPRSSRRRRRGPPTLPTAPIASRVDLPVVKTSSTMTAGSPGSSRKPRRSANAPSCRSTKRNARRKRARRLVPDDQAAQGRRDDDRRRERRTSRRELPARRLRALGPHEQARALEVAVRVEAARESRKWPVEQRSGVDEILQGIIQRGYQRIGSDREIMRSARSRDPVYPSFSLRDLVVLDLLVEVRARRLDDLGRPADVPAVLAQLGNEELRARRTP